MQIRWRVGSGLGHEEINGLHRVALRILDEVGLRIKTPEVPDAAIKERLSAHKGVRFSGDRTYFSPDLIERLLDDYRSDDSERLNRKASLDPPNPIPVVSSGHSFYILNPETDELERSGVENLTDSMRVIRAFEKDGLIGQCPGYPTDVPTGMREISHFKMSCECGMMPANPYALQAASRDREEKLYDFMFEIADVIGLYKSGDPPVASVHPISPLKLEGDEFDNTMYLWKKRPDDKMIVSIANMPIAGVSAPIDHPSAFALSIAETLGSWAFFTLMLGRGRADFSFNVYAFDMKHGTFVYGCPEDLVVALARRDLFAFYGSQANYADKALRTMAHSPDAQAAAEKMGKVVVCLMAGAQRLNGAGGICLDEGWSAEQLVIDLEIIRWARRAVVGFDFTCDDMFARIVEGIENNGDYLSLESSAEGFRKTYWMPELFEHLMVNPWMAAGGKTIREMAREKLAAVKDSEPFTLPEDQQKELDEIYGRASKALA